MIGQTQVSRYPAYAVEGALGSVNAVNPLEVIPGARAVGTVYAGRFVWSAAAPAGAANDGIIEQFVANAGSGAPRGIAYRNYIGNLPADKESLNGYEDGMNIPVAKLDSVAIWVKSATAASVGQKVYAVLADGTIKTGASGATISGAVETDLSVVAVQTDGAIGDLILISK